MFLYPVDSVVERQLKWLDNDIYGEAAGGLAAVIRFETLHNDMRVPPAVLLSVLLSGGKGGGVVVARNEE
jgi:hypothetical protein